MVDTSVAERLEEKVANLLLARPLDRKHSM